MEQTTGPKAIRLARYRAMCQQLPQPTEAQIEAFARHVAEAHSWYKHLPLNPPGSPLHFFIDPYAGLQRVLRADGQLDHFEREKPGFHYSWIPSREYRKNFGHLAYSRSSGMMVGFPDIDGDVEIGSDEVPIVGDPETGRLGLVPRAILKLGQQRVTGMIHSCAFDHGFLGTMLRCGRLDAWPDASGGDQALRCIRERCEYLGEGFDRVEPASPGERQHAHDILSPCVDLPLYRLLEPERRRQLDAMAGAIRRVIQDVWSCGPTR